MERIPQYCRTAVTPVCGTGILADGNRISLDGSTTVTFKLGSKKVQHQFLIAKLSNHILLGLDFLEKKQCHIDFKNCKLSLQGSWIQCCNADREPLQVSVQVKQLTTIPAESELMVNARLNRAWANGPGCVEATHTIPGMLVATSLHEPQGQDVHIRILNTTKQPIVLRSGKAVAKCTTVEVQEALESSLGGKHLPPHLEEQMPVWGQNLSVEDIPKVKALLCRHQAVFSADKYDVGRTHSTRHIIPVLEGTRPIKQRPYRHGPIQEEEIEKQVKELKEHDLIREGRGAWSSPVVLVKKKDGSWRFCVDYRRLNEVTSKDAYPLPRIDDSLDALGGSQLFSTLDLTSGYWQVELEESAKEKAAFVTRSGLWEWEVLPFGLTSAPSTFERLMETVLRGLHWKTLLIYLDDIIVFSKDLDTHLERLGEVFNRLAQAGLKLKPSKCTLFNKRVQYLGHVVSDQGVETDESKVQTVRDWPVPRHKSDVRAFLGTCGYYRRFISNYSEISRPLTQLSSTHAQFHWDDSCQHAFETLKQCLMSAPILAYPDYTLPFVLDTDASDVGCGAVLSQSQNKQERVIAYYSKMFSSEEANYCVTRKELLAIVKALKHFRPQLYGRRFTVRTDHASLVWLLRNPNPTGQLARWIETLSEYDFELIHRKGLKHSNADGLSRQQCLDCQQCARLLPKEACLVKSVQPTSSLAVAQLQDLQLGPIYQAVRDGQTCDAKLLSKETQTLADMLELLSLNDQAVLCISLPGQNQRKTVAICPSRHRKDVISSIHSQAHLGFNKTLTQVQLKWYWPGMSTMVRQTVACCTLCQQAKKTRHKNHQEGNHLYAGRPWQIVAVDLCGPLPETTRGNTQILVLADHFTRWYDAIPIRDGKASTIAQALEERVFAYFGIPETIHSDRGAQFESELLTECCKLWGCKKTRTSPYHPQGNSVVERLNRTLGNSLRALLAGSEHKEWDELLPQIMRAVRASPHRITKETANYLMLGRETRLPDTLLLDLPNQSTTTSDQYALDLENRLRVAGERLRQQQYQLRTEQSEEPPKFRIGEKVWLKSFFAGKGLGAKLRPKYVGPYVITKCLPYQTYEMKRNGKTSIQHEGRIRLYVSEELVDNSPEQMEEVVSRNPPSAKKRTPRVPTHLKDYHLDRCKLAWPILGQNRIFEGGGEVNSKEQTLNDSGGPEKGRCVNREPCLHPIWMSTGSERSRSSSPSSPRGSFGSMITEAISRRGVASTREDLTGCHRGRE